MKERGQRNPERTIHAYRIRKAVHQEISDIKYCAPMSGVAFDILFRAFSLTNVFDPNNKDNYFVKNAASFAYRKVFGAKGSPAISEVIRDCLQDSTIEFLDHSEAEANDNADADVKSIAKIYNMVSVAKFHDVLDDLRADT